VLLAVMLVFPFFASQFGNSWVRILDMALLYIMLALGLNIVVGFAGLLDLGYIAFFAVGAYLTGLMASPQFASLLESVVNYSPALGDSLVACSAKTSAPTAFTCRYGRSCRWRRSRRGCSARCWGRRR
jgi:branched-chain amino acid transport system permease protein